MKIIVFSQVPPPVHGSTVVTLQLLEVLDNQGHTVTLLDRRFSRSTAQVGVPSAKKILSLFSLWVRTLATLRQCPDAVIFFGTNRYGSFLVDHTVAAIFRLARVPIVQYIHTVGYQRLAKRSRLLRLLVRAHLSWAAQIVCLAPSIERDIAPLSHARISTIGNAVEPLHPHPREHPPRFIYLANLIPSKGARDVVEIARRARDAGLPATFEIYGYPGDPSFYDSLLRDIAEVPTVAYGGSLTGHNEKSVAVGGATALLYPSTYPYEAQPLAIIEAMSAGVPTLAYDVGAIRELLGREKAGLVCRSVDEMFSAVEHLARADMEAWRAHSISARRQFDEHHTIAAFSSAWTTLLSDLMTSRREC